MDEARRLVTAILSTLEGETECKRKFVRASLIDRRGMVVRSAINGSEGCRGVLAVGSCGCEHAEQKLLSHTALGGVAIAVTYSPCSVCASLILDSPWIKTVVYEHATEHDLEGIEILQREGVMVLSRAALEEVLP